MASMASVVSMVSMICVHLCTLQLTCLLSAGLATPKEKAKVSSEEVLSALMAVDTQTA